MKATVKTNSITPPGALHSIANRDTTPTRQADAALTHLLEKQTEHMPDERTIISKKSNSSFELTTTLGMINSPNKRIQESSDNPDRVLLDL